MRASSTLIEVAVGVVLEPAAEASPRVLVAKRPEHSHQGGKWEFPGGKREPFESITEALSRELKEELGISVEACEPLIRIRHDYPEKSVLLDVWTVTRFQGIPHGREGQPVLWKPAVELEPDDFPPANRAIIQALRLPDRCLITPDASQYRLTEFVDHVETALLNGIRLVQLRSHDLSSPEYFTLAGKVATMCVRYNAGCILNAPIAWWPDLVEGGIPASGFHLTSQCLRETEKPPEDFTRLLSASCHTEADIEQANKIGANFIFLSPVKPTVSHPGAPALGWDNFSALAARATMPVYALGGLTASDICSARRAGAQGIAAIRSLWPGK